MEIEGLAGLAIILTSAIKMGTPLLFATVGGVVSERAGVINLGLEGLMLIGALTALWWICTLARNCWPSPPLPARRGW
jgi:simple sugar transport system permease protein